MIFSRRALQRRLDELRTSIGDGAVDGLAKRLNKPGADRMAAMWEVVILYALSVTGNLRYEVPLTSGKAPDIELDAGALQITADVVCVCDQGLEDNNPYRELSDAVRHAMKKLGITAGSLDLRVKSNRTTTRRGTKTVLRLPPRKRLQAFVETQVEPRMREQKRAGEHILRIAIDDDDVGIEITIDPGGPYQSTGGYGAYDIPGIRDRNPLYGGLERKAEQLRASKRLTGVIVGDGDCRSMAIRSPGREGFSPTEIVREFFRRRFRVPHHSPKPGARPRTEIGLCVACFGACPGRVYAGRGTRIALPTNDGTAAEAGNVAGKRGASGPGTGI